MTTNIDLSTYLGKKVIAATECGHITGLVERIRNNFYHEEYEFSINGWYFTKCGRGRSFDRISSITEVQRHGIAQKAPKINLDKFTGGRCLVVLLEGEIEHKIETKILRTHPSLNGDQEKTFYFPAGLSHFGHFTANGKAANGSKKYIAEIYAEGAYTLELSSNFEPEEDPAVTAALDVVKNLNEEQIAALLHSLKKGA